MTKAAAYTAASVFDGVQQHRDAALLVKGGRIERILPKADVPADTPLENLGAGALAPGFVDLQVNGGGGVMFNDNPSVATLETMAHAHAHIGATSILPTLITDTPDHSHAAIDAVAAALKANTPGLIGLHLEGPHLSLTRKGAHDPGLIRPMRDSDVTMLTAAAQRLPILKMTLAPENASPQQIRELVDAGVIISLGHTDASYGDCADAAEAGASCATHLFNAMSQLGNREPGLVGAALSIGRLSAGLIADGIHVHPQTMAAALRSKSGPGQIFLVSDAMATAGSEITSFTLNGRRITRDGDRLTLQDGTLAGAHLELATAVRMIVESTGTPLDKALAMATSIPAQVVGRGAALGCLNPGTSADFIHLHSDLSLAGVWRAGVPVT